MPGMHHLSKINDAGSRTPELFDKHSSGFRRATYVDYAMGSVHMGVGVCFLDPNGVIKPHIHSFEESFYILSGSMIAQIGERNDELSASHFGLIGTGVRHSWRNASDRPASWLEMQAPQPRPFEHGRDTFFVAGDAPNALAPLGQQDGAKSLVGYFDPSQLPRPGEASQMEGFNPTAGVAIKMFVDRSFGAVHQSLFLIQYMPGAKIDPHDHTFEESYLIVSGQVRATADGHTYDLGAGDVIWTSVGCIHSFENVSSQPVCWIETQAPLPPSREVFRFERDWAQLGGTL